MISSESPTEEYQSAGIKSILAGCIHENLTLGIKSKVSVISNRMFQCSKGLYKQAQRYMVVGGVYGGSIVKI